MNKVIRKEILKNHISFWLNWNHEILLDRIKNSKKRPLAFNSTENELIDLIKKRSNIYSKALYEIKCDKMSKSEIVKKVLNNYEAIKLKINTKTQKYSIIIGSNLVSNVSKILKENSINFKQCLLVIDKNISKQFISKIKKSLHTKKIYVHFFKANEINKNFSSVNKILDILLNKNFSREDCVISIGGGITGDISGFAASLFKRGLKFINIPTTLLSQVDSSIGGKTGVNY